MNGGACKLLTRDHIAKRWHVALLPDMVVEANIKEENLEFVNTVKEIIGVFKKTYEIDGQKISVRGTPQGSRLPIITAKFPNGTFLGGTRVSGGATAEDAYRVVTAIVQEMQDGKLPCNKDAFHIRRSELLLDGFGVFAS